jgi:hypothetical protein
MKEKKKMECVMEKENSFTQMVEFMMEIGFKIGDYNS